MIGRFNLNAPKVDNSLSEMIESHRMKTGQDYGAIMMFGLWGTVDCSPEVRLYAAYMHLQENPEDGPSWLETARIHLEAEEPEEALAILDEVERLDGPGLYTNLFSEDPEAHRALVMADSGQLDAALEILDSLRARHDDSPVYHYTLGTVLHEKKNFHGAAASYEEALETLEQFRLEAQEEDMLDELNVDFPAAEQFVRAALERAKGELPFENERPLDLSGFRMEDEWA